jgi:hypothetical protein
LGTEGSDEKECCLLLICRRADICKFTDVSVDTAVNIFTIEDEGNTYFNKVDKFLPDYMVSLVSRQHPSDVTETGN